MAKKQAKSVTAPHRISRWLLPVTVSLLVVVVIVQSLFITYLLLQNSLQENARIGNMILESVENMNQPLPQDPKTGTVFIHEAKLTLPPPSSDLGRLVYAYDAWQDDASYKSELHIARQVDIISAGRLLRASDKPTEEMFDSVPRLQACSRGITVTYNKEHVQQPAGSKTLANGKTVYFSTEPLCKNDDLLKYVKEIDSYN